MPEVEVETRRRFEELALPHLKSLYRFASRLTGNRGIAEDLVQETFLKALESFPALRDPARSKAWLFRILSRLAVDRQRSVARAVNVQVTDDLDQFSLYDLIWEEDPLPYSDRLHEDFLARFRDEEVRAALSALPEAYLAPLLLIYLEGMKYREVAEVLELPMGTVMSRLHRGRKILERELWEYAKRRGLVKTWEKPSD
jgi:RNA polymerase sigma-70 factor (ECF subfamily)